MKKPVKQKDIARKTGFSLSTVSRALSDHPSISEYTKQIVNRTAGELGYISSAQADTNGMKTAGMIVPEVLSDCYAKMVYFAKKAFVQNGYSTLLCISDFDQSELNHSISYMRKCDVQCILLIIDAAEEVSKETLAAVRALHIPTIFIISCYLPAINYDYIYIDERRGNAAAVEHLLHRDYRYIGFIGENLTLMRRTIFLDTLKKYKMPIDYDFIRMGTERAELGGYLRMKEILSLDKRPDAIYASYDQMAIGAIHAIQEAGLRIPEDIAVIGFDDITVSKYVAGGITTIANPCEDVMTTAVRTLMQRVKKPYSPLKKIAVVPELIVRRTT